MTAAEVRFASPPVQEVELTLYFERVPLKITALAPLVTALTARFPEVQESFARVPWAIEESGDDSSSLIEEGASDFPFPWLVFSRGDGHAIGLQDDRLLIRWSFNAAQSYPGYNNLRAALRTEFEEFARYTRSSRGSDLQVSRARCEYTNAMPPNAPWTVAQRAYGVGPQPEAGLLDGLYGTNAGGGFHFDDADVVTHVEFAAVADEEQSRLSLRATAKGGESLSDSGELALLDLAHSHLISCFSLLTTEEQQIGWGRE